MNLYILDEAGFPQRCHDLREWAIWFGSDANRQIAETFTEHFRVSTIFLGIDHSFRFGGKPRPPVLYETMVFDTGDGSVLGDYQTRYCSRDDALAGHNAQVKRVAHMESQAGRLAVKAGGKPPTTARGKLPNDSAPDQTDRSEEQTADGRQGEVPGRRDDPAR
jgi:hypothetical protein